MPHELLGLKAAPTLAGFIGGVASLAFAKQPERWWQKFLVVFVGTFSAAYLAPLAADYAFSTMEITPNLEGVNALAFLIGLTSMNLLAGLFKLSERFKRAPEKYLKRED